MTHLCRTALLLVGILALLAPHATASGVSSSNRVVNGDAEQGMLGWLGQGFGILAYDQHTPRWGEDVGDTAFIRGATSLFAAPHDGAAIAQAVDFSDLAGEIDAGRQPFSVGAFLGGRDGQAGGARLVAQPLDGAGGTLGPPLVVGPPSVRDRQSRTRMLDCFLTATAPVGMRSVHITIQAVGHGLADGVAVTPRPAPRILPVYPPTAMPVDADGPGCPPTFAQILPPAPSVESVVTMRIERARGSRYADASSTCRRLRFRVDREWRSNVAKFRIDARGKHHVRRATHDIIIKAPKRRLRVAITARLKDGRTSSGVRTIAPC